MTTTRKKAPSKKKVNPTVYFIAFEHGSPDGRMMENTEGSIEEFEAFNDISHIKAIEQFLTKEYINPKVINFIPLRKKY
jgi:hypothetical protein